MKKGEAFYRSHGERTVSLFAKLLFSRESFSLAQLAQSMQCQKNTVLNLLDKIQMAYGVEIEKETVSRENFYKIPKGKNLVPMVYIAPDEMSVLLMCKAFTEQLLGKVLFEYATRALDKGRSLLPENTNISASHFSSYTPGSIDYTPFAEPIKTVISAMESKKVCCIKYRSLATGKTKKFHIEPLRLFSHNDTIYLHAKRHRSPGEKAKEYKFYPLLAVHRIKKIKKTKIGYQIDAKYNFNKFFNKNFGIIKDKSFRVKIKFSGFAAKYVVERIWSPDQKVTKKKNGNIVLKFSASSKPEIISWILSWGHEAEVIKPKWLIEEICKELKLIDDVYS